ncbi:MAG: hypothetical protein HY551_03930 [Elusimicrobia bacterium]|nr:hypothetical protein [Elusimicrobiota bacterium]
MRDLKQKLLSGWIAGALVAGLGAGCTSTSVRMRQPVTATQTPQVSSKWTGPRRRIGIVDFVNKSSYGARLGSAASDILITELTKTGKFVVVEREKINKILEEQKLQASGAIDPRSVIQVGKILGLNAIVTGAVSQFGVKTEGFEGLVAQSKRQIAEATVDIRVVDAETGQVLYAESGKGAGKSVKRSFLGLGGRGGYDETLEGEALRAAIAQFTENIVSRVNARPWSCRIAGVSGELVYLNAGEGLGLERGAELECFHLGKEILDPTTGLILGYEEAPLGRLRVTGPLGDSGEGSVARFIKTTGAAPAAKDICRWPS